MSLKARTYCLLIVLLSGHGGLLAQAAAPDLSAALRSLPRNTISVARGRAQVGSLGTSEESAAPARVFTLEALVAEALEKNPEILAARSKFHAATKRPSQV